MPVLFRSAHLTEFRLKGKNDQVLLLLTYVSNCVFRHGDHREMAEMIIIPQIKATIIQIVALVRLLIVVIGASLKILRPIGPQISAGDNHVKAGSWLDYRRHKLTEIQFVIKGVSVELQVLTDSG